MLPAVTLDHLDRLVLSVTHIDAYGRFGKVAFRPHR